jgi:hypothetical protein
MVREVKTGSFCRLSKTWVLVKAQNTVKIKHTATIKRKFFIVAVCSKEVEL